MDTSPPSRLKVLSWDGNMTCFDISRYAPPTHLLTSICLVVYGRLELASEADTTDDAGDLTLDP